MNLVARRRALGLLLRLQEIERWEHLRELHGAAELRAVESHRVQEHLAVVEARNELAALGPHHIELAHQHADKALAAMQTVAVQECILVGIDAKRRTLDDLRTATEVEIERLRDRRELVEVLDFFVARQIFNRRENERGES